MRDVPLFKAHTHHLRWLVLAGRETLTEDERDAFADKELQEVSEFAIALCDRCLATKETHDVRLQLLKEVEGSIGVLHRLSLTIRKASNRNTIARLPKLIGYDEGFVWGKSAQSLLSKSGIFVDPMTSKQRQSSKSLFVACCNVDG